VSAKRSIGGLPPWEHPDWYDLHDTTWTAGPEREPEHYRELVIALPPLDRGDHLLDVGSGTGKASLLAVKAYPRLGRVTLVEPNRAKLARARERVAREIGARRVVAIAAGVGDVARPPRLRPKATIAIAASVFQPALDLRGGTLRDGLSWLGRALRDVRDAIGPGGTFFDLETLAAPWAKGGEDGPSRRLFMGELVREIAAAGFESVECVYRFRDRVILRAARGRATSGSPPRARSSRSTRGGRP
jgi:SAM-dependent methyltransferase